MTKQKHKSKYIHGYSKVEQNRLVKQAQFFEPWIYCDLDFSKAQTLLEVGCGVGAQTEILLKRWPHLKITAVDRSDVQLQAASERLQWAVQAGRVRFIQSEAEDLSGVGEGYDAAFVCWFLEHVPTPKKVLQQIWTRIRPGGTLFCNEVHNAAFFLDPYSPAVLQYAFEFNDYQWATKGHPFIGAQLGNFLLRSGFEEIHTNLRTVHCDSREPQKRKAWLKDIKDLLLSAEENLLKTKRVTPALVKKMKAELQTMAHTKDSVLMYSWMQSTAQRPM